MYVCMYVCMYVYVDRSLQADIFTLEMVLLLTTVARTTNTGNLKGSRLEMTDCDTSMYVCKYVVLVHLVHTWLK